jgi:hypothetical protein
MIHPASDKPNVQLICHPYEHYTSVNTRITIDVMQKDVNRDEMIEILETFMKSMGYYFSPNECLGIEEHE